MKLEIVDEVRDDYDYYLGDLNTKQKELIDKVYKASNKSLRKFNKRIQEVAAMRGKESKNIVLKDAQIKPMLISIITKRFFLGDKPGLGKTIMSAGMYANYMYHCIKNNKQYKKVLVVTDGQHVIGFANEWKSCGINVMPLVDGSTKIDRKLKNEMNDEYDGIVINWDGLKTNAFLDYYMRNKDKYGYAVFDETGRLTNDKSMTYKVVDMIVNHYKNGIERVIFLNGSSFEKNIFDFYYQFKILKPKLIPNKQFLEDNYVVRGGIPQQLLRVSGSREQKRMMSKAMGPIIDYKNQSELRDRLKYYYMARSKKDYATELPKHSHRLHLVEMTPKQKKWVRENNRVTILNSPTTVDEKYKLTRSNTPKYALVLDFIEQVIEDRPIIYVYNKQAQYQMKQDLEKNNYKVEIINGDVKAEDKTNIIKKFNDYKLDILIINVERAINLPTSDRIIFYDILTMPQRTEQIKGRIDRDNYDTPKFYDFFCYKDSPEMLNIIRLAYFREKHGNKFTGQEDYTYRELIEQLIINYGEDHVNELTELIEKEEDFFDNEGWEDQVQEILW